jgi:nucleotide-binding universal stress UspA family protein
MKILIGYDGSESSDAALDDLKRAGLPRDSKALVISVGDLLMSSPSAAEIVKAALTSRRVAASLKQAQTHATRVIKEASEFALKAADTLRTHFPEWSVRSEVITGTPVWELIDAANRWEADLVVVGSHGRSAIGRLFLGSVSKRLATDASCSVRVARGAGKGKLKAPRIIIGVDGSPAAEQAIHSVGQRVWEDGTEVKLIAVDDGTPTPARVTTFLPQAAEMLNSYFQKRESRVRSMLEWATGELNNIGLKTSVSMKKGDPSKILLAEARKWNTDCIFVGTRDFSSAFERFRLGSVSTAIVTNAHCSVEIVRPSLGE